MYYKYLQFKEGETTADDPEDTFDNLIRTVYDVGEAIGILFPNNNPVMSLRWDTRVHVPTCPLLIVLGWKVEAYSGMVKEMIDEKINALIPKKSQNTNPEKQ